MAFIRDREPTLENLMMVRCSLAAHISLKKNHFLAYGMHLFPNLCRLQFAGTLGSLTHWIDPFTTQPKIRPCVPKSAACRRLFWRVSGKTCKSQNLGRIWDVVSGKVFGFLELQGAIRWLHSPLSLSLSLVLYVHICVCVCVWKCVYIIYIYI